MYFYIIYPSLINYMKLLSLVYKRLFHGITQTKFWNLINDFGILMYNLLLQRVFGYYTITPNKKKTPFYYYCIYGISIPLIRI